MADPFAVRARLLSRMFRNGGLTVRDALTLERAERQCKKKLAPIYAAQMRGLRRIERKLDAMRAEHTAMLKRWRLDA